jgi:hypothetical protein
MELAIDNQFWEIVNKDFKKFKSYMLDTDEDFISYNKDQFEALFLYSIVNDGKIMRKLKTKLVNNGMDEKYINELFYNIIKYKHKMTNGIWSWNEIDEYDIPLDDIKKTTTKFCFI